MSDDETAAAEYDSHPLLSGKAFYLLPLDLLTKIVGRLAERRMDQKLVEMELAISRGATGSKVGRFRKSWITYEFLARHNTRQAISDNGKLSQLDTSPFVRPFSTNYLYSPHRLRHVFQSYLGWLLTNLKFLDEHDDLFSRYIATVHRWGIERIEFSPARILFGASEDDPKRDPAYQEFHQQMDTFCFRWRLLRMVGPYLPIPVGSQADMSVPVSYFISSKVQTGLYLLPDIVPVPSRDEIRRSIDESRSRIGEPDHLSDWFRIIRSGNKAKNRLSRFARIFGVQHYWRVLANRHKPALRSATGKLDEIFAKWLRVSAETIRQDRREIRRRLGEKWLERKSVF
jgi:hypothetical protein